MKLDQIAYAVNDDNESEKLKYMLGLTLAPWVMDRVTARCKVWDNPEEQINIAKLEFCDVLGIQFEIIRYLRGANWLTKEFDRYLDLPQKINGAITPFVSHVGFHLDPGEDFPEMIGCKLAQEARTMSHTCEYLTTGAAAGRKYHYKIFEVSPHNYMKFIRRINP